MHPYFSDDNHYFETFNAVPDDMEARKNLIAAASNCYKYNTDIFVVINEKADTYFTVQNPIDETAEIIQNNVKLYLDKQIR